MDFSLIIKAREVLQPLWEKADLKGRCWGPKRDDNPYSATNITFVVKDELISVSQSGKNTLIIHEFQKTTDTELGKKVKEIL